MRLIILVISLLISSVGFSAESLPDFNKIVDAIYIIEGGSKAKVPYGILSVRCNMREDCRKVCLRTVKHKYSNWAQSDANVGYLDYLADKYCPPSVDKIGNLNWKRNIKKILGKQFCDSLLTR